MNLRMEFVDRERFSCTKRHRGGRQRGSRVEAQRGPSERFSCTKRHRGGRQRGSHVEAQRGRQRGSHVLRGPEGAVREVLM